MKYRSRKRNIKKAAAPIATAVFVIVAAIFIWDVWIRGNGQDLSAECEFHFIDVGQGDSTLIVTEDAAVLIDAGPTDAAETTGAVYPRVYGYN